MGRYQCMMVRLVSSIKVLLDSSVAPSDLGLVTAKQWPVPQVVSGLACM